LPSISWKRAPTFVPFNLTDLDWDQGTIQVTGKSRYQVRLPLPQEVGGNVDMGMSGTFLEIVPPERIVHTETFDQDWTGGETLVTTTLHEANGRTMLSVSVRYASAAARGGALKTGMAGGMSDTYDRLVTMLAPGEVTVARER
jgi:uncharacterized protein YndB with AHSA1/START domain